MRLGEDIDWLNRVRERGVTIAFIDEVTMLYRRHDTNATRDAEAVRQYMLIALKKSLDRRRSGDLTLSPLDLPEHLRP
jgi:hypothetical protein